MREERNIAIIRITLKNQCRMYIVVGEDGSLCLTAGWKEFVQQHLRGTDHSSGLQTQNHI